MSLPFQVLRDPIPFIMRPQLSRRVAAIKPRLLMLNAPAGFGKSYLASEIADRYSKSALVDCALSDDEAGLARAIVTALGDIARRAGDVSRDKAATATDTAQALVAAERLWSELDAPGLLIFENAEVSFADPRQTALLRRLMRIAYHRRTILFCSRVPPPARLCARIGPQERVTFTEDDLRFTASEAALLLERFHLSAADHLRLQSVARGWPIALRLFEHLMFDHDADGAIAKLEILDSEALQSFVVDEVLPSLDGISLDALRACTAIPAATRDDFDALFGTEVSGALAALSGTSRTPFVYRTEAGVYDPHPLIRSALRAREAATLQAMLVAAAERHRENGNGLRAAQLFMHAGVQRDAAASLGPVGAYLVGRMPREFATLLSAFDGSTLVDFPDLWQAAVMYRGLRIHPDQWLAEAEYVWAGLGDRDSISTWCGVALNLINCYINRGRLEDVESVVGRLERFAAGDPAASLSVTLTRLWIATVTGAVTDLDRALAPIAPLMSVDYIKSLVLYEVVARFERFARGDLNADQRSLAHAIEIARRLETKIVLIITLVEAAFAAWFAGDDQRFDHLVGEITSSLDSNTEGGAVHFLDSVQGRGQHARLGAEKLHARAFAQLIGASRAATLGDARLLCAAAIATSDESRQPAYQVLARVAMSRLEPPRQSALLAEAASIAAHTKLPALQDAVTLLATGAHNDGGILSAFVGRFQSGPVAPRIEVQLSRGRILAAEKDVALGRRQRQFLFLLATDRRPIKSARITDALWPDSDGDHAVGALRVVVNRVRQVLGTDAVVSVSGGYRLAAHVHSDLLEAESVLSGRLRLPLLRAEREALEQIFVSRELVASDVHEPWRREIAPRMRRADALAGLVLGKDALVRGNHAAAVDFASTLVRLDPANKAARLLLVLGLQAMGDAARSRTALAAYDLLFERGKSVDRFEDLVHSVKRD